MNTVMNAYITDKLDKGIAHSTFVKRALVIKKLYQSISPDAKDFSFMNNTDEIKNYINNYKNIDTRWNVLMNIIVACRSAPEVIADKTLASYGDMVGVLKPMRAEKSLNNTKSPKQQEQLTVTLEDRQAQVKQLIKNLLVEYELKPRNKIRKDEIISLGDNIYRFARKFQEIVGLALYAFQPALRADYAKMRFATSVRSINNTDNWMVISQFTKKIYMNHYKNAQKLGHMQIQLEPMMITIMRYWISVLTVLCGETPEFVIHYSIEAKSKTIKHIGKEDMLAMKISRDSKILLGQQVSIQLWRHLWEIAIQNSDEYRKMTIAEREFTHRRMLHSKRIAELYNLQDPKN